MQESSEQNVPQSNDSQNQPTRTIDPIAPAPIPAGASGGLSGQGVNAMPEETKGWSWAGFFLTWVWGVFNGVWISLLAFVVPWPIMNIILGMKGKEWAWQGKKWDNVEQFRNSQHKWNVAGIILGVLGLLVVPIILFLMVIVALNPTEKLQEAQEQQLQQQDFEFSQP